ncbi:MAG: glycosyltransferase family A protein, partial [Acetobacteraceae bacterium]
MLRTITPRIGAGLQPLVDMGCQMNTRSHPLVAVVTPVFNSEEYLPEAMESVQALDYPNIVHIILDNASDDASPEIIDRYRNRHVPLLTRRRTTVVPMAANWNAAVDMVPPEARYFRVLCSDDTLSVDAISRTVDVAERDPAVNIVGCLWRAHGLCGQELAADRDIFDGKEVARSYLRREHNALSGNHVLVRRTERDLHRPFYDESIESFDSDANLRISVSSKYGFVRKELGIWRVHPNSITSRIATRTFAHEMSWLSLLDRYAPQLLGFREYIECRSAYR